MPKPTLTTYGGKSIPIGGAAELDDNLPVTIDRIRPPADDDDEDPGSVTVRYEWGATENVDPARLGAHITA